MSKKNKKLSEADKTTILYNLIKQFDFSKVRNAMFENDWKWFVPGDNENEIPSIERLVSSATRAILNLLDDPKANGYHSGGFRVIRDISEEGELIEVLFVLELAGTFVDEFYND